MTREEHLKFCKNCTKQQFDTRNGIVCSITNKIADFENECPNYEKEETKTVKKELNNKAIELLMQNEEFKISSTANFIGLFLGTILLLAMTLLLIWMTIGMDFHFGMVFGILIYTALVFFTTYQFIFTCDARVKGDKVILKKLFRPAKSYTIDKIGYPTSFQYKRTKYTTVRMENTDNTQEKYLIVNSRSIFSLNKIDAEEVLTSLRNLAYKYSDK